MSTSSALEQLAGEWRELFQRIGCRNAFLSVEWMASWWDHWGTRHRLSVIVVRNTAGRLVAVAPFYIRRSRLGKWGLRALCFLAHRWVGSDHLNVLVDPEYEQPALEAIVRCVEQHRAEWDYIELADSAEASPAFARLCQGFKSLGMTERVMRSSACPYATLPPSFEEYLAGLSAKQRFNFRRYRRMLAREGECEFLALQGGTELQERFGELVRLHRLRFQHQRKHSSFLAPGIQEFHADALNHMAAGGMARLFLLQVRGKAVAALYGFSAGKRFSFYQFGMDPAWSRLSVGLVMIGYSIEEAIRSGHDEFDFLRGDEAYKFRWAAETRRAVTTCLFDRRVRSRWAWPQVWVKTEVKRLARRYAGVVQDLLPPQ